MDKSIQAIKYLINSTEEKKIVNNSNTFFDNVKIAPLIKKYGLPDSTQKSFEQGLRNAAANNKIDDLKIFIKLVKNINAQDVNPNVQRTALHWAAIKGHKECYQLLINADANPDIPEAAGETASMYIEPFRKVV